MKKYILFFVSMTVFSCNAAQTPAEEAMNNIKETRFYSSQLKKKSLQTGNLV